MGLLPLVLSAHASAFTAWAVAPKSWGAPLDGSCRFCGGCAADWQEPFHLNGDHTDGRRSNVVPACVLCHLSQHLERSSIDEEAMLVWLPEMSQAVVNVLARGIHGMLVRHGESPRLSRTPASGHDDVRAARSAFAILQERAAPVRERFGTISPRDLGAVLLGLDAVKYAQRETLLGGVRLLPLGRFFRDGSDIYPALVSRLAQGR